MDGAAIPRAYGADEADFEALRSLLDATLSETFNAALGLMYQATVGSFIASRLPLWFPGQTAPDPSKRLPLQIWRMAATARPKVDNRKVLVPDGDSMKKPVST